MYSTLKIFSCEDAAQQVLMSVCLSVCPCVVNLKTYHSTSFYNIQNVPEYSRRHAECIRMFQKACRMFQNVPECMQNVPECSRIFQNACSMFQKVPECSRMHAESSRMHAECSRMFQNVCRMFSYISLHAVT